MIPLMIFKAKVTMPPRGIEMKPHQVSLKTLMTVVVLLKVVMLMNKVHHLVSNLQCLTYPCMTGDYLADHWSPPYFLSGALRGRASHAAWGPKTHSSKV